MNDDARVPHHTAIYAVLDVIADDSVDLPVPRAELEARVHERILPHLTRHLGELVEAGCLVASSAGYQLDPSWHRTVAGRKAALRGVLATRFR